VFLVGVRAGGARVMVISLIDKMGTRDAINEGEHSESNNDLCISFKYIYT
jgi:hypothetical protein